MRKALITGITGQDGSYLAELLLEKRPWYSVYGVVRRSSSPNYWRIEHILDRIHLVEGDVTDPASMDEVIKTIMPDEVYNLAAQSFVGMSWKQPNVTTSVNSIGVLNILEAIRKYKSDIKFYQASTSEMFGNSSESKQNEDTPFHPRSPYGISKLYAHWLTVNYRESYGLYSVSGILFNHESPRRGIEFVTRKVSQAASRIKTGNMNKLELGNLDSMRDWGYAKEYVEAMWLMLQKSNPEDFVIATGETHSIQEMVEIAFNCVGLNWKDHISINESLKRPADVSVLCGDATKANEYLHWVPKTKFKELIEKMVYEDLAQVKCATNSCLTY